MRRNTVDVVALFLTIALCLAASARAESSCTSVLTAGQVSELDRLIFPGHPFSPHLSDALDSDTAHGLVRRLTASDVEQLHNAIAHPFVGTVGTVRPDEDQRLKAWLNANPPAELPAWDASASDSAIPSVWVPATWIGRTAASFVELMREPGNAGPMKTSTLGSAKARGHTIGVTEHTIVDPSGQKTFLWTYIYRVTVDGRLLTTLLAICRADVVTMSDDEQQLRALEQQLARAWSTRDRATVERILTREWSLIASDGTWVKRADILAATFDTNARIIEAMVTDDDELAVSQFGDAAVVRGRTVATVVLAGVRRTTAVRFTDVFIKREGVWQMVASHQTGVAP
jgi:hypothetical protein